MHTQTTTRQRAPNRDNEKITNAYAGNENTTHAHTHIERKRKANGDTHDKKEVTDNQKESNTIKKQ